MLTEHLLDFAECKNSMETLIFEKVGDVNSRYPYICIYAPGQSNPFMEIGVSDRKEIQFTVYPTALSIVLGFGHWEEILKRAREFLPRALADEDACLDFE
jgi:hypothetical protein